MARYRIIGSDEQPLGDSFEVQLPEDADTYLAERLRAVGRPELLAAVQRRHDHEWRTIGPWVGVSDLG